MVSKVVDINLLFPYKDVKYYIIHIIFLSDTV